MERVIRFFQENPLQFCATVGRDGSPRVRPFQMMYTEGNDLYYCTGAKKEVYAELSADPRLELCASTSERWVRVRGRAEWVEGRAAKERVLAASALVRSIYKSADNPDLKVFRVADAEAVLADFSGAVTVRPHKADKP